MLRVTNNMLKITQKSSPVVSSAIKSLQTRQRRCVTTSSQRTASASPNVIVHIGSGAFHRAHQAWYLHRLIESGDKTWSYALGNIRDDMTYVLDALAAQNGQYTLETVSPKGERTYETIKSIKKIVPWDRQLKALVHTGAAPETKIMSFTVTEAGYYLNEHHRLDPNAQDIVADLEGQQNTIYGAVAAILEERMKNKTGKVSLLSCDNVMHNGDRFKTGLLDFLQLRGQRVLSDWMLENTTCPNAMVDRITPRPTPDVRQRVFQATGFDDRAPVMGESFIQWVVEDNFSAGRPNWENVGVELVQDVVPYEEAKIKILNSTYKLISLAGTLIGKQYMNESSQDPDIYAMAVEYINNDAIPSLSPNPLDLVKYRDVCLERFCNPYIMDTAERVACFNFSVIPAFYLPTLHRCFQRNIEPIGTANVLALFFRFMERWHNDALPYPYRDDTMDPNVAHGFFTSADPIKSFLSDKQLWGRYASSPDLERVFLSALTRVDHWLTKHTSNLTSSNIEKLQQAQN